MLASSLAKILDAILSCTSSFCHLALPIFVALSDSCVEPLLKTASQLVCLSIKATCGGGDMITPYVFEKLVVSTLRITPLDLCSSCEECACRNNSMEGCTPRSAMPRLGEGV